MDVGTSRQQAKGVGEFSRGGSAKQQRKQGPHGRDGEGAIDTALAGQLRSVVGGLTAQRMDVVAQNLGCEILRDRELRGR